MRHTERQRRIQYVYVSRYGTTRIEISGQKYECNGSPISHFSCSFVLYFLLYFTVFLPHSHVATYSHYVFPLATNFSVPHPARMYHTTRLSWFLYYILTRLCRATLLSIIHECQRICTYLKFELQPITSLLIYNFAYAHYMFDEFIVTNIHDTQDHTRIYVHVRIYASTYIYISFRLILHFI